MSIFRHTEFDDHEQVAFFSVPAAGLRAIVAIHSTVRGPSLGGCRMYPYADDEAALTDVLRLSRGMTYKSAISALPLGGGKAVIIGDPARDKTPALFEAFGECLNSLGGRYIVAEDSGTSVDDLHLIGRRTPHISGIESRAKPDGGVADGDPSPATAEGVLHGMRAAVRHTLRRDDLRGLTVAVQGVGAVGRRLTGHLVEAGADVVVTDVFSDRLVAVQREYGVRSVAPQDIYQVEADVFAPCALGAILNSVTIAQLRARIVAGAANNQLATAADADLLQRRGIVYVPDFAINAGGVIDIAGARAGHSYDASRQQLLQIAATVTTILQRSADSGDNPHVVAEQMARHNLRRADQNARAR